MQHSYDVFPRLVRAGSQTRVTIRPQFDHSQFKADQPYQVTLTPAEGLRGQMGRGETLGMNLSPENGALVVPASFESEQETILRIDSGDQKIAEFRLFALNDDLFPCRPYKGDFHLHTHHSDGKESPAYVAAACRKIGLDFMAITDHARYAPSLEAIRAFADAPIDLRIYPGEEVHPPGNPVHMLNFGGSFSINALFDGPEYPESLRTDNYASCAWCFDKIRQAGGLGVFCHPSWYSGRHYDVPSALIDLLFERQPFDALEVIGGYFRHEIESNTLQVARYHEERARGKRIPIVGVSDSHGCETGNLFGWYYTIAFSPSLELPDLIASIKQLYSVAVEALPGETARTYGPYRLVRYAQFLLREIFPLHDEICVEEGRLMLAYAGGDPSAAAGLAALRGRVQKLYDHLWG